MMNFDPNSQSRRWPGVAPVWAVTTDNEDDTYKVQRIFDADNNLSETELDGVVALSGSLAVGDIVMLVRRADGKLAAFAGGVANTPITVSLPAADVDNGDYVDLANFTIPSGKQIYILAAVIANYAGSENAGYDLEAYNVTDSASIYETSSGTVQLGSIASPLNDTETAEGDQVVIRAENNSGTDSYLTGFMTFVIA